MRKYLPVFLSFIFVLLICINLRASESLSGEAKSNEVSPDTLSEEDNPTPLNKEVRYEGEDQINKILRNMVVVQRKAKNKAGHFLFNPSMGLDFSDGPTTFYTFNANLGYAVSDFWEFYVNYVPKFVVQERGIVKKVSSLNVVDKRCNPQSAQFCTPQSAQIFYERPMSQLGVEIIFAPSYGKESWGTNTIFRSDTFFKLGLSQIKFETGHKGMRYAFMLGKTFFVAKYFNTRMDAGIHYMQTFVDNDTKFSPLLFVEAGLVFYF